MDVSHPIRGAIHVTECHDISFLEGIQAQQLRLHLSYNIHCYNIRISAGTILEDCHHVMFYIPSTTTPSEFPTNIKDFNWLRNGVASPNFALQIYDPTNTLATTTCSPPSAMNDPTIGRVAVVDGNDPSSTNYVPQDNDDIDDDDDDEI